MRSAASFRITLLSPDFSGGGHSAPKDDNPSSSVDWVRRTDLGAVFKRNKQPVGQRREPGDQVHRDAAEKHRQRRAFLANGQEKPGCEYNCYECGWF